MPPTRALPSRAIIACLLAASPACRSLPERTDLAELRAHAAPSMEEIFLIPGIQGRPPRIAELSADGRWVCFRFNPLETTAAGVRSISDERALRIQSTEAPDALGPEGRRVDELLPARPERPKDEQSKRRAGIDVSFSHAGSRMLALRDQEELFLLDPPAAPAGTWTVRALLVAQPDGAWETLVSPRFSEDDAWVLVQTSAKADDSGKPRTDTDLWRFRLQAAPERAWPLQPADGENLTATIDTKASDLTFSRDLRVAFVREGALGKIDVPATETTVALQRDAQVLWRETGKVVELAACPSWKDDDSTLLSPDGRFLFGAVRDRTHDPDPTLIPNYLTPRVSTARGRSNLADDGPSPRKLSLWNTETGERTELQLGDDSPYWLGVIGWAPQPDSASPPRLALARKSADFRARETFVWTEADGLAPAFSDQDERWLGGQVDRARWTADGRRLVFGSESFPASTTRGHAQLFDWSVDTRKVRQLTQVGGEVNSFDVARDGSIAFSYSELESPDRCKLGWITPAGQVRPVAAPEGCNMDPQLGAGAAHAVFMSSRMFQPAEIWSVALAEGRPAQALTHTADARFTARDWIHPARFDVAGEGGARVYSHVYLPRASSLEHPDRPRGCIVFIHGAGYLQNVTDSMTEYEPNLLFHSRLAGMGYAVVDVDYRGSAGYGQTFRTDVQYRLGELELKDIDATLDELGRRGVIDRGRVACYGGSYGGFLTLMALFNEGDKWCAGAALRSVTDWRTYGPEYTQPRLGKPSTHADAYARSSPIDHAEGLTKPLLLLHGMMDSNVFAQDTIRLMEKLIDLGKDFDAMLYPSQNHAFADGAHWLDEYKRIEKFLMEHVGPP